MVSVSSWPFSETSHQSGGPPADLCLGLHALGNWAPGQHVISGQEALFSQQGHGATGSVEAAGLFRTVD